MGGCSNLLLDHKSFIAINHSYILISSFRYIELTEEDKEKLKGSYKVAKKLEKLENRDKVGDSDEDDDYDCDQGCDYPSLDSFASNVSDPALAPGSPESSMSPRPGAGLMSPSHSSSHGQGTPRSTQSPSVAGMEQKLKQHL